MSNITSDLKIQLILNTDVTLLSFEELEAFIVSTDCYRFIPATPGYPDNDRVRVLQQMWKAQVRIFDIRYAPLLAQVREILKDVDEDDLFALGLDHVGDGCPPN